jgi:hypothetical protein
MTTPTRTEIETCAKELWHRDRARLGDPSFDINPELNELKEGGYLSSARSELMTNTETKNEQWLKTSESVETSAFEIDIQQLFESNALVLGSRHTGKSDLAMMISDKVMLENAVIIVFDPSLDWSARSSIPRVLKVEPHRMLDVPCESTIFDISLLSPSQQQRIVENFSEKLFEHQAQAEKRRQYLVIFEEAHTYFYQGCMRAQNMTNTVRLLSVGRNVEIACVLVSQFASMLDKFCVRHALSQAWFGFTKEPNDIKYLRQILGSEIEKLSKLDDGEFLFSTRHAIQKISIEPYTATIQKQQIVIPQSTAAHVETRARTSDTTLTIARLILMAVFCAVMAKAFI